MKGDFTRLTFDRRKHYSGVRMQQGRVQLDADWNEHLDIAAHRTETECVDTVGPCGAPMQADGFRTLAAAADLSAEEQARAGNASPPALTGGGDFLITAGRYYVHGWLTENERIVNYAGQPDFPAAPLPVAAGVYIAYLDVWQRHITTLEDPSIREVALGGPDTATRTRTVWQVRCVRAGDLGSTVTCLSASAEYAAAIAAPTGQLAARAEPGAAPPSPCVVPADAGYRRLENQLYRIEVHVGGPRGTATFKWSRDNGSIVTRWETQVGPEITVASAGRDKELAFAAGQWVELIDDARELRGEPGTLVRISAADGRVLTLDPATADGPTTLASFGANPRVRRWDSNGTLRPTNNAWFDLEDGVQARVTAGTYRTGDYWLIPARTVTGDIEWPATGGTPDLQLPHGVEHRYCRLAVMRFDGAAWTAIDDCRRLFPPLTALTAFYYVSGDGQEAAPADPTMANTQVPLGHPIAVGVSNGTQPVTGARVRFRILSGAGRVAGAAETIVSTDAAGVAQVAWTLGWNRAAPVQTQQVEARLLDAADQPLHLPVVFTANLSRARAVAYEPGGCDHLLGATNVQEALDALCALADFFYLSGDGQETMPNVATPAALVALGQPLRVGVARGPSPVSGARVRFSVVSGGGRLAGNGASATITTGADGVASCAWELAQTAGPHVVEARLLDSGGNAVHLPIRFNANLSVAAAVAYDPRECPRLAGAFTVQAAIDILCRSEIDEPGVRVRSIDLLTGAPLRNDTVIASNALAEGIVLTCDDALAQAAAVRKPVFVLTAEIPQPIGTAAAVGVMLLPIILDGNVGLMADNRMVWAPGTGVVQWLTQQVAFARERFGRNILVRMRVLGNFIWAANDPERYLDGEVFGAPAGTANQPRTEARLPSGNARRGGDLEMWFWLGPAANAPNVTVPNDTLASDIGLIAGQPLTGLNATFNATVAPSGTTRSAEPSAPAPATGPSTPASSEPAAPARKVAAKTTRAARKRPNE